MSIIASSMFYTIKNRSAMASIANAIKDICGKDLEYQRKYSVAGLADGAINIVMLDKLFVVSVNGMVAVSNSSQSNAIIDIVGRFFDKDAYTTNARKAIDAASIIIAGTPRAVTRIDIDTGRFEPESDVLIKRVTFELRDGHDGQLSIQMSVFGRGFEIDAGSCIDDAKKILARLLNDEEDEE